MGRRARALMVGVIGLSVALVPAVAVAAGGETPGTVQVEEPAASFNFAIVPKALPAGSAATVKVEVEERAGSAIPPGIATATIGFDKSIDFDPRGLPVCPWGIQIDSPSPDPCRRAIVGHAEAAVEIALPEAVPFTVDGRGPIYNGGGRRLIAKLSFPLPLSVSLDLVVPVHDATAEPFGSEMAIKVPEISGGAGHVTSLGLELGRSFVRHGQRAAYVTAECPDGKLAASASVVLGDGREERIKSIRACSHS